MQLWLHNRNALDSYFSGGEWLLLALHRLFKMDAYVHEPSLCQAGLAQLKDMHARDEFISILPFALAKSGAGMDK